MSKILIIEDELDVQKVVARRLSQHGFEVVAADDGCRGVELAHTSKPDLIILDFMLPAGNGLMVLKNLRSSSHTRYIPVVILTSMKDEKYKQMILGEGVNAYLEKPYEPDELIKTIEDVLKKEKAGSVGVDKKESSSTTHPSEGSTRPA
jgi:DNA-binding response OmpR family regulator